ncbi:hypothetical protein BAOM_1282 [Peribacillus asahii]|uniref:Uncharacterized protein n=1 Tax=Peribacillus asahii TaxID=228899 RepID=A0A3T0KN97_9BACI|nr:hypothetical protein BAOM_1282 [Peribacillus asahii]
MYTLRLYFFTNFNIDFVKAAVNIGHANREINRKYLKALKTKKS